jgi:HTH-type transcriptional regulator/antitoxin HigA
MEQNALTANDLSEIADADELLEIINGHKELNARQIHSLSNRFHVSPAVFI